MKKALLSVVAEWRAPRKQAASKKLHSRLKSYLHSAAAALPMLAAFVFSSGLLCVEAVLIRHHHAAFLRPDFPSVVTA